MPNLGHIPHSHIHRPAHWNSGELKEAFAFWIGFEALLNVLGRCGLEFSNWLRGAMEHELLPGLAMAFLMVVAYTPASRYAFLFAAVKNFGYQIGQLRVEQIIKCMLGHHMRTVLLWAGGTACIHFGAECTNVSFHRPAASPAPVRMSINDQHHKISMTPTDASHDLDSSKTNDNPNPGINR